MFLLLIFFVIFSLFISIFIYFHFYKHSFFLYFRAVFISERRTSFKIIWTIKRIGPSLFHDQKTLLKLNKFNSEINGKKFRVQALKSVSLKIK